MSKFYEDTFKAAKEAATAASEERKARAQKAQMVKATKDAITEAASKGAFSCLVNGVEEFDGKDTTRTERRTFNTTSGPERIDVIDVGSDVVTAVCERLEKLGFDVSQYAVGIKRISWQSEKKEQPQ